MEKKKEMQNSKKKLSYYYHFSGALFSQHPHANKGSSKARQFIFGVPLKFFWRPKNFLQSKNLVIHIIYALQKKIYKSS
jgi:hypothetical protein